MSDNDLDDIFGEENSFKEESSKSSETQEETPLNESSSSVPQLLAGRNYPSEFKQIVKKCNESLKKFPKVDYDEIYEELETLAVRSSKTPTLDIISEEIAKIQAIQDRLTEIYIQLVPICGVKKRYLELLRLAWMNYASGGSKDKREGEASSILVEYEVDYAESDSLKNALLQIIKNAESILHSYSRRITVFQIQSKQGDFGGRSNIPEINFQRTLTDEELGSSLNQERDIDLSTNDEDDPDIFASLEKETSEDYE